MAHHEREVKIGHHHMVFVPGPLGDYLASGVAKVAVAVKLAYVPGSLASHPVDGPDEVAVGNGVGRLLQAPQVFRQSRHGGRGIENNLSAIQAEGTRPFREVAVVTNIHPYLANPGCEDRVSDVARPEVELLPEPGRQMGDMCLAVLA